MQKPTQDQIDRANEWTAEHYPNATDAEHEEAFKRALADAIALDAAADARDEDAR